MYEPPNQKGLDLYLKTLSWARLNFELQSILSQPKLPFSNEIKKKLYEVGYTAENLNGSCPQEMQKLFNEGEFFSCMKTGNRIVAFALKENGLNRETFKHIEKSITDAYLQIKQLDEENRLLDRSYTYTLEALAVFRL
jgi:hypothetical protein